MKSLRWLFSLLACLLWANLALADVVETTPYPYAKLPPHGVERGTYAFNGSGLAGADCFVTLVGAARLLSKSDWTAGTSCAKANIQTVGVWPECAQARA